MVNKAVAVMDSGTQQNAALVEQASAAAQALTEQAGALTQLIARYNVGGEPIRPSPAKSMPAVAPPMIDSRRANRPWSTSAKAPLSPAAAARRAVAETDAVWKEF
jgi:methyl-accepting chemotaxis protein